MAQSARVLLCETLQQPSASSLRTKPFTADDARGRSGSLAIFRRRKDAAYAAVGDVVLGQTHCRAAGPPALRAPRRAAHLFTALGSVDTGKAIAAGRRAYCYAG